MTMETRAADSRTEQDERRQRDRFYGDRRGGVGLYAEVSRRAEQKVIAFEDAEQD